ncbi:unnamed protein product [Penicillium glandicola]
MKKQLRQKCPFTISPSQFATFIDRELGFPDRDTESKEAWFHTCLLPPSRARLLGRCTGDRIRSQTVEPNSPTRARRLHVSRDEVNDTEEITADNNTEEGDNDVVAIVPHEQIASPRSLQGSQPMEVATQEVVPENLSHTDQNSEQDESEQSSSEEESSSVAVPVTPCRTPKRPKTPKSSRKSEVLPSSVMSLEAFRECFDRCVWKLEDTIQSLPPSSSKKQRTC